MPFVVSAAHLVETGRGSGQLLQCRET